MRQRKNTGGLLASFVALALLVGACTGDDEPAAETTIPSPAEVTTSSAPDVESSSTTTVGPRISDPVVEYYAALNAEDVDRMLVVWPTGDRETFSVVTAGLHARVSVTCRPGDDRDATVECVEDLGRNDLYTPAGVTGQVTVLYTIADGVIVDHEVIEPAESVVAFEEAFSTWLETTHPDVHASYQAEGTSPFATVEDALEAIALVDEFLAESDDYPLGA
jgi:hypothetical protein